ncbi:hypothetical protein SPRG_20148 [Saprolegnia parasitica CBS 223.65]|uniref:Uncharacterized protein n=1 Tax=Saprolegnia parasitica (strain CBS 223.65) TaxID=695850 RepID=A0A067CD07_SAPPC|nr:hypothetical protein SPRG_20148 [Saprolegnia parasitica CBS 223.65]KDO28639.1 hypothetical protein SPRG_20148 [Saprolegnia parasitica CBS 223.65]|eukprot:XP_012200769.1 hypothetical protein SPRG_20148 [Saprolegnia parasitica CBS 223.65]
MIRGRVWDQITKDNSMDHAHGRTKALANEAAATSRRQSQTNAAWREPPDPWESADAGATKLGTAGRGYAVADHGRGRRSFAVADQPSPCTKSLCGRRGSLVVAT